MLRLTLISLLALAITAPPANAQLPQGSVRGTVTDQNSRDPLPGVIVLVVGNKWDDQRHNVLPLS